MTDENSWRTPNFRQSVVQKIDEAVRSSGMSTTATTRNSLEMESHVYQKAKSKEEYLGFVARLILHVREINAKKAAAMSQSAGQAAPIQSDQINTVPNLAAQGSKNSQTATTAQQPSQPPTPQQVPSNNATSLLQSKAPNKNQIIQLRPSTILSITGNALHQTEQTHNTKPNQMANVPSTQPNQIPAQVPPGQTPNQMGSHIQVPVSIGNQMPTQISGPIVAPMQNPNSSMMMNVPSVPRNPTPGQFPTPTSTQSVLCPVSQSVQPNSNQIVVLPSSSGQISMIGTQQRTVGVTPSPYSVLNTSAQQKQSAIALQDETAYQEKIIQMNKYIQPLRKKIVRMGNIGANVVKLNKLKKLLSILSNPHHRMPLDNLLKCEAVLEKIDFKCDSVLAPDPNDTVDEHHDFNSLIEAVRNNLESPMINHTLYRTFGPTLEALFCPELTLAPPLKKKKLEKRITEIPDVLQAELARLDPRFQLSIDPNQPAGSQIIHFICWLDDVHLPCVPPIFISVCDDYPCTSPKCQMVVHEYTATPFLSAVRTALLARIGKMPKYYSVSQLLDTWEMSVRQATAPNPVSTLVIGL